MVQRYGCQQRILSKITTLYLSKEHPHLSQQEWMMYSRLRGYSFDLEDRPIIFQKFTHLLTAQVIDLYERTDKQYDSCLKTSLLFLRKDTITIRCRQI